MKLNFFKWPNSTENRSSKNDSIPIVFLHGMGGTGQIWRPIAAQLEDEFCCMALDQRGHGFSRPVPKDEESEFHARDYAKDVALTLESLLIDRYFLVGHSMGVRTALALAHLDPKKISGLIAVDIGITSSWGGGIGRPLADFIEKLPLTFPNREEMRAHLFAHCPDPSIAQYLSAVAKKTSESPEAWSFPFDHEALVKTIHQADEAPIEQWLREILDAGVKVTFLRGANSKVWLKEDYEAQKVKCAHPNLEFQEWEHAGHGIPFEQRAKFIALIQEKYAATCKSHS